MMRGMVIDMNDKALQTLAQLTPYQKLKSLHNSEQLLEPGITFEQLDAQASAMSDNDAAQRLNNARAIFFKTIFNRSKTTA